MRLFKKEKREKLGFDLQNPINQRMLVQAALDNKIILITKGSGVYLADIDNAKEKRLHNFLKQFINTSVNCKQGVIDRDDPKFDYIIIYDKED